MDACLTSRGHIVETTMTYAILVEQRGPVALITLNRPQALNALNARGHPFVVIRRSFGR